MTLPRVHFWVFWMVLAISASVLTFSKKEELQRKPLKERPMQQVISHPNCTNITTQELQIILKRYPFVEVRCLAEKTILRPSSYQISARWRPVKVKPQSGPFTFIECELSPALGTKQFSVPVSPCLKSSANSSGSFEIATTMTLILQTLSSLSSHLSFLFVQGSTAATYSSGGEATFHFTCSYEEGPVRPMVEVSTIRVREQRREWVIESNKLPLIEKSPWTQIECEQVQANSLMFSCVSSKYVSDICEKTGYPASGQLDGHIGRPSS